MHAVVTKVTIHDPEAAANYARDEIAPRMAQSPGFVTGHWVRIDNDHGTAVLVFESEEEASRASEQVQPPPEDFLTLDSVEVGEVVANA